MGMIKCLWQRRKELQGQTGLSTESGNRELPLVPKLNFPSLKQNKTEQPSHRPAVVDFKMISSSFSSSKCLSDLV